MSDPQQASNIQMNDISVLDEARDVLADKSSKSAHLSPVQRDALRWHMAKQEHDIGKLTDELENNTVLQARINLALRMLQEALNG